MHSHDQLMHDLICNTLRETNFNKIEDVNLFNYKLGVAIHNIPNYLREDGKLPLNVCLELNELDPSAKEGEWGEWVKIALATINQELDFPN